MRSSSRTRREVGLAGQGVVSPPGTRGGGQQFALIGQRRLASQLAGCQVRQGGTLQSIGGAVKKTSPVEFRLLVG